MRMGPGRIALDPMWSAASSSAATFVSPPERPLRRRVRWAVHAVIAAVDSVVYDGAATRRPEVGGARPG